MSIHQCPCCGYQYDEALGEPHEGYAAGTRWETLPESFVCPSCSVRDKADFVLVD
jgi:rubredoxin